MRSWTLLDGDVAATIFHELPAATIYQGMEFWAAFLTGALSVTLGHRG